MNILAITYSFVPLRFPATFRILKWCKGLGELGHRVTIVAVHPDTFIGPKEPGLQELVSPCVTHVMVRSPENNLLYRALSRRYSWFYKFLVPRKMEWLRAAKRAVMKLDLQSFDVVFSCSQPPVCHLVGYEVKKETGLPWVAFFSDPWVGNPMAQEVPKKVSAHNVRLESEVVRGADRLIFPSSEMARHVARRYDSGLDSKIRILPHCYVPDWYHLGSVPTLDVKDRISLICAGSFYGTRTPLPLFEALRSLQRKGLHHKIRVEILGEMAPEYLEMLKSEGLSNFVEFRGTVDYLESLGIMKGADFLVLVDTPMRDEKEAVFLPSKLIDYLGAQRPVLGLAPTTGAAAHVLTDTGNVICDLDSPASLAQVLESILDGSRRVVPNEGAIARYEYRRVTQELQGILLDARKIARA